jgi:hypothetical protein
MNWDAAKVSNRKHYLIFVVELLENDQRNVLIVGIIFYHNVRRTLAIGVYFEELGNFYHVERGPYPKM